MCSGIKVTCSFMMNCHVIICINVCNWFSHLQPEWQTICQIDYPIFTVQKMASHYLLPQLQLSLWNQPNGFS